MVTIAESLVKKVAFEQAKHLVLSNSVNPPSPESISSPDTKIVENLCQLAIIGLYSKSTPVGSKCSEVCNVFDRKLLYIDGFETN